MKCNLKKLKYQIIDEGKEKKEERESSKNEKKTIFRWKNKIREQKHKRKHLTKFESQSIIWNIV